MKKGDQFKQKNLTIHIAVGYLERCFQLGLFKDLQSKEIQQKTLALACLEIASKYDELDDNIPFVKELIRKSSPGSIGTYRECIKAETQILRAFNWNLMMTVPQCFLEALFAQGIAFASDTIGATHKKVNSHKRSLNNEGSPGSP